MSNLSKPDDSVGPKAQLGWLNGYRSAVSLTFDDGMDCHLDPVIPILEDHNLRGTFYPIAKGNWSESETSLPGLEQFRPAVENGHEIGNHSIHHWCSCAARLDLESSDASNHTPAGLEYRTLADLETELDQACQRFEAIFPEITLWSFCYPCYNTFVGRGTNRYSYVPLVAGRFFAARGGGEMSNLTNSPYHADLHCLMSWKCENRKADDLIELVQRTNRDGGGWNIFTLHGVGGGHLPIEQAEFEALCHYLQREKDTVWIAPLVEVALQLHQWRQQEN